MRKPIIAGNWKMNMTNADAVAFVKSLNETLAPYHEQVESVVCPSFVALSEVSAVLEGSAIKVGAQTIHWEANGAYTSQIAPNMLQGLVDYVIIGHSENRAYLAETDEIVNKKVLAALANGFKPIVAVGESLEQNENGETQTFVAGQVRAALAGVTPEQMADVIVAYEPIWAIGTGKSASGKIANDIIGGVIRATLRELYGDEIADSVRIQYGGSVKPNNMDEYMQQPDIDGALVGGASLKVDAFTELVKIAAEQQGA